MKPLTNFNKALRIAGAISAVVCIASLLMGQTIPSMLFGMLGFGFLSFAVYLRRDTRNIC